MTRWYGSIKNPYISIQNHPVMIKNITLILLLFIATLSKSHAQTPYPQPVESDYIAKDFTFESGEKMAELRVHCITVREPHKDASGNIKNAVLIMHGTTGDSKGLLNDRFAGHLFGAGQPLDATKYYIVFVDGIGHGKSSKPSDGLKTKFPKYDYADMVDAHYRLLTEGLGIKHARLVTGNSIGGMHAWLWAGKYPDFMDAAVPMASQPTPMAARNWMMRRLIIDTIKSDPDWNGGTYASQPKSVQRAAVFYATATSGGTLAYAKLAPTRAAADKMLDERLAAPFTADANDYLYQWESSGDYDPTPLLPRIIAKVLLINSADDERNPPETGATEQAMKLVKNGSVYLIPASTETRGHGTTAMAKFWKEPFQQFLAAVPERRM